MSGALAPSLIRIEGRNALRRQWFKPLQDARDASERSVVVITGRCQRLNPGSSPGARTTALDFVLFSPSLFDGRLPFKRGEP